MTYTGNDDPSQLQLFGPNMTVLELVTFVCIYRSKYAPLLDDVRRQMSLWCERVIAPMEVQETVNNMLLYGWLIQSGDRYRASEQGRELARPLLNGVINMLDHGTRLLDVGLMMSVLRLNYDHLGDPVEG